ncbi:MAG: right-handed parallel beta-helix repeat-containing protein [Bacteroidales bacterium]|nr:right-handed parallel beta-helix repeat-containing protein [Bacteroidales bacterium]
MKRILLLALSLVLLTNANLKSQNVNPNAEIIIGEGTSSTGSIPTNTYYSNSYTQQIYLASEMGGKSVIDKIYFQYTYSTSITRNIDIYVGNTEKTSFTSGTDYVPLTDMSLVFSGDIAFNNSEEWFEILLDTPFAYDGSSSLVIAFDDNTGSYQHNANKFKYHTTSDSKSIYVSSDGTNYDPASPVIGNASTYRNNIKFSNICITAECCYPPMLSITEVQAKQITFTYEVEDENADLVFEYKRKTDDVYTEIENVTASPFTLTGLTPSVEYDIRAKAVCSESSESIYVNKSYVTPSVNLPVIYVDADADGLRDGSSWENAIDDLNAAFFMAELIKQDHGAYPDVWVAAGTYYGDGTSTNAFIMAEGVNVYGGFAGTETSLEQRDYETNVTILDGQGTQRVLYQDKAYTEATATVWDGITIQNGGGAYSGVGAYIQEYGTLRNCTIKDNGREVTSSKDLHGGGVYINGGTLEGCNVHDNIIRNTNSRYIYGAGVYMTYGYITDCEIYNNEVYSTYSYSYANYAGVYVYNNNSSKKAVVENSYVHDNHSQGYGGGMYLDGYTNSNHVEVINCRIENNEAEKSRGGVYANSYVTLIGCNISNNTSKEGSAGLYLSNYTNVINCNIVNNFIDATSSNYKGAGIYGSSNANIYNCVVWGNKRGEVSDQIYFSSSTDVVVSHSAIEGGYSGIGNISLSSLNTGNGIHPKFTSPTEGVGKDYYNGDWSLQEGSALVNKGVVEGLPATLTDTDMAGNVRIQNERVDIGAMESSYESTMEIFPDANNIIYVTTTGAGKKDGSSWSDATPYLSIALSVASTMNPLPEIWVAAGTYYGDGTSANAFRMAEGVNVYGGFAGTETSLEQRDYETNVTIIDGQGTQRVLYQDKVYTESTATVWDGVTIQNGGGEYSGVGAYIREYGTLRNCTIKDNGREFKASDRVYGGGVYVYGGRLEGCKIHDNLLKNTNSNYIYGAGVYMKYGYIADCEVFDNEIHNTYSSSYANTAGIHIDNDHNTKKAVVENCYIHDNYSHSDNGGMYLSGYSNNYVEVINSRIENNVADGNGGGVHMNSYATLVGCIISNNTSNHGSGVSLSYYNNVINCNIVNNLTTATNYDGAGIHGASYANIYNCVIWGNKRGETSSQVYFSGGTDVNVSHSAVEGGYTGVGNVSLSSSNTGNGIHPKFANPSPGVGSEYRGGDWTLQEGSACINKGIVEGLPIELADTDLMGNARIQREKVDIGAIESSYESTMEIVPDANNIIYVTFTGAGKKDGSSWTNATPYLSVALSAASTMNPLPEIWVASGTYYGDGTSTNAFRMVEGVNVYGGFAGMETSLEQRNFETNVTILDGQGTQRVLRQDNLYTEVTATVWDGFTIQNGGGAYYGAGAYIQEYVTLRNCTIKNNGRELKTSDRVYGGGVYINGGRLEDCKIHDNLLKNTSSGYINGAGIYMTNGYITDCEIYNNEVYSTYSYSYASAAGVYVDNSSSTKKAVIENCYVHDNYSHSEAGGIRLDARYNTNHIEVINSRIENNYSERYGGGLYILNNVTLVGCNISNNTSDMYGAGVHSSSYVNIINCNIVNNYLNTDYQNYQGSGIYGSSYTTIYNSIIWGNKKGETSDQIFFNGTINVNVSYSAIEGGYAGTGNISLSGDNEGDIVDVMYPKFVSPTEGVGDEYSGGDWGLQEGSACINNGNNETGFILPSTDLMGNERIQKNTIDIGAIESPYGATVVMPGDNNVIYVATESAGLEDGTSWENATSNLQLAINRAAAYDSDPQVWVKAGTYSSNAASENFLTMAAGVEVFGGFAGTETSLEQRDFSANKTILDGGNAKRVIYQNDDYTEETVAVFDGFVIQNGNINANGAGVYMRDFSVLRNCVVRNNTGNIGSAIYTYGYANIVNCLIAENISTYNSSSSSSVYLLDSTLFVNNTVVNNSSVTGTGGVYVNNQKARIYNSIIWGNKKGENVNNISGQVPDMRFSAVEGGYVGIGNIPLASENTGNTGYYPCFNDIENDDYSLTANSICVNKGSSALMTLPSLDLNNGERVKQGAVDIGAFESNHIPTINIVPDNNNIIYVATAAAGKKDGSSWADATSDIILAMNLANTFKPVADVWVKAGTYYGLLYTANAFEMIPGVKVYGGFAGTESTLAERDLSKNTTILDGNETRRVLNQSYDFTSKTLAEWDGFTIRNGNTQSLNADYEGAGVRMREYSNIKNSTIINNNSRGNGAIYVQGPSEAYDTIANCIVQSNDAYYGGGIYANYYVYVVNSLITNNSSYYEGGGVYMTNNVKLINNTIANNNSERGTGGLHIYSPYNSIIRNNIIWGNKNNDVSSQLSTSYTSGVIEYNAIEGGYEGKGNITLESANSGLGLHPDFVNPTSGAGSDYSGGDWSLSQNSICINKGTTNNVTLPLTDLVGNERVQHGIVDFGAYESSVESSFDIVPDANNIIYVKANGTGDGSSWANATSDLQFAIARAGGISPRPAIWVAKGTYRGDAGDNAAFCLSSGVSIYGGFAGDEPHNYDLSQRDFVTNAAILDGMNTKRVLLQLDNFTSETAVVIDGFTIRNGYDDSSDGGAAAYLRNYTTLRNCQVYDNVSERYCGAIRISGSSSIIENCVIRNNRHNYSSYGGGGVYLYSAKIINSKITDNYSDGQGGGIYASGGYIINCLVSNNTAQMSGGIYGSPALVLNTTVVKNSSEHDYATDYAGLRVYSSTNVVNCIVWGNTHNGEYSEVISSGGSVTYSAIHGGHDGTGNIDIELDNDGNVQDANYIRFIDADHDVYELTDNSVAVDAGNDDNANITEYDLNGKERVKDGTVDMGAFEQHCVKYKYISKTMGLGQSMSFYDMTITEPGRYQKRWALDASCDSLVVMDVRVNSAIFYVTTTGAGLKDGSSWDNAADNINTAVVNAHNSTGFDNKQVWVAAGTYTGNNSGVTFPMVAGVEVYGGFVGTETLFSERDVENNKTILTGNNSYSVLGASQQYPATEEFPSKWDGFFINSGKDVAITEHNILQNSELAILAEVNGGLLQNCTFNNVRKNSSAIRATSSTIRNCKFVNNNFESAMYTLIILDNSTLDSCQVYANSATTSLIKATRSNIVKSNIFNNTVKLHASGFEGIINASDNSTISHTNLLNNMVSFTYTSITSHFDGDEDYYHQYKYAVVVLKSSTLKNSILWNNAISSFDNNFISKDKNSRIDYCAIDGALYNGVGNIRLTDGNELNEFSPCFVNPIYDVGNIINQNTFDWNLKQNSICLGHDENGDAIGAMPSNYQATIDINPTDNIIYVTPEGSGSKDGSSWSNATPYLQYAVSQANTFDPIAEVWVKAGTYNGDGIVGNNAFNIVENVKVYGGFAGMESSVEERDLENNKSILDGQNVQRVLFQNEPFADGGTTLWDGFVIRNGYMSQADFHSQNSIYCRFSDVNSNIGLFHLVGAGAVVLDNTTLKNITFDNNKIETDASIGSGYANSMMANTLAMVGATADGIAIVNATTPSSNANQYKNAYLFSANSHITNSTFKDNAGKIFIYNTVLDKCEIKDNQSLAEMPVSENYSNMILESLASTIKNSKIHDNKGVTISKTSINGIQYANTYINTIISNNEGLAIVNHSLANGDKFINCDIVSNTSTNTSSSRYMISGGEFHNTVVWNNRNGIGVTFDFDRNNLDKYLFNNSAVELGLGDNEEVVALASSNSGDSQAYGYANFISPEGDNYELSENSVLIDAGDNTVVTEESDIDGKSRIGDGTVDIGALESSCVLKREYRVVTMSEQYPFYGEWLTEPGTYIYRKEANNDCDSVIVMHLTFKRLVYVNAEAKGLNNGTSWENAYTDLKMACDSAQDNGNLTEIWVAKGRYRGDGTSVNAFILKPNTRIYGGFTGTELADYDISQRDIEENETILDGGYIQRVISMEEDATEETPVIVDGFTITKGFSRQDVARGTALSMKQYFEVRNCIITDNCTNSGVGAIYVDAANFENCNIRKSINTFENCDIHHNQGSYVIHSENTSFINCKIENNDGLGFEVHTFTMLDGCSISNNKGRAIRILFSAEKFTDELGIERYSISYQDVYNTVINNNAGGIYQEDPKLVGGWGDGRYYNTVISNNKVTTVVDKKEDGNGGAIRKLGGNISLYNCTVINNSAKVSGGGLYGKFDDVVNTIISGNKVGSNVNNLSNYHYFVDLELGILLRWVGLSDLRYCAVEGGYPGEGNITLNKDYPLSISGSSLTSNSVCINAGTDDIYSLLEYDLKGKSRVLQGRVDIGAEESNYAGRTLIAPDANNVIYVDVEGKGDKSGSSWANATADVQMAMNLSMTMELRPEIWMKKGNYTMPDNEAWAMFTIVPGTKLYGGFNGDEDPASFDKDNRDLFVNKTVLDAKNLSRAIDHYSITDNYERSVIDGFTIKNGNAEPIYTKRIPSSVTSFPEEYVGGAIRLKDNVTVTNCDIYNNVAKQGGALYAHNSSDEMNIAISYCKIHDNYANEEGGAISLTRNYLYQNTQLDSIVNCEISNNKSDRFGGMNISWTKVLGSTIVSNNTEMYAFDTLTSSNHDNKYYNCILWNNVSRNYSNQIEGYDNTYEYCAIHGGYTGVGNITLDKYNTGVEEGVNYVNFIDPEGRAYQPKDNSAVVDKGNNEYSSGTKDLAGKERIYNETVDMGAYETGCINYKHLKVIANEKYVFYGDTLRESGYYSKQWTPDGLLCDSLVTLELEVRKIWYVKTESAGKGDGSSWNDAMSDLQAAINKASAFQTTAKKQIWVAKGTYMGNGSSMQAFQIKPGVEMYGGFAGTELNGIEFDERDLVTNETVLSGANSQRVLGNYNSYSNFNVNDNAVIDGFTIQDGYTTKEGGGIYVRNYVKVRNCIIKDNQGGQGAGIYADNKCEITDCKIYSNTALSQGGGVFCKSSILTYCEINNNLIDNLTGSAKQGGGIYGENATINNCLIANNSVLTETSYGGGMYIANSALPSQLLNCTMVNNFSYYLGGGVYSVNSGSNNEFINCIMWGNKTDLNTQQVAVSASNVPIYVRYCAIQGGAAGIGTIKLTAENGDDMFSPRFVNPTEQVGANYWGGDWRIEEGSICINMGERLEYMIEQDLDDEVRVKQDRIDIGAYETDGTNDFAIYPDENNIIYVKKNNAGSDMTGSSWSNAIDDLQLALNFAADNDNHPKVWVAKGTYTGNGWPYVDAFIGLNGIDIYGGFAGNEAHDYDLTQRDLVNNATILDGQNIQRTLHQAHNTHFKYSLDPMHYAIYDGLVIRNGFVYKNFGGNVLMRKGEIRNSIIENGASIIGASDYISENSMGGAGIYAASRNVTVIDAVIRNNKGTNVYGGGYYGPITFKNCLFNNNSADYDEQYGGNVAHGGAGYSAGKYGAKHYNSTIVNNYAHYGNGGIVNYDLVMNSVLWGNKIDGNITSNIGLKGDDDSYSTTEVYYSAVEGGCIGEGNITLNAANSGSDDVNYPMFVNPTIAAGVGNYGAGDWRLQDGSVCANRGTIATLITDTDIEGNARIVNDSIDMGAYESDFEINHEIIPDANNIIYVTEGGAGTKDGSSWDNATPYLQFAMDMVYKFDGPVKFWIAEGAYRGNGVASNPAFLMTNNVYLYGGFEGNEAYNFDLSLRDFETNQTIFDGQNLQQILIRDLKNNSDVYNRIDGITFQNARSVNKGAAARLNKVYVYNSTFKNNTNLTDPKSSGGGGALYTRNVSIHHSKFFDNYTTKDGGAILSESSFDTIAYCVIKNNTADEIGGAIKSSAAHIYNTEISYNTAKNSGGVSMFREMINSTVVYNTADAFDEGKYAGGITVGKDVKVYNSIIWGNRAGNYVSNVRCSYPPDMRYSACERDQFVPSPETNIVLETSNSGDDVALNYVSFINPSEGDFQLMEDSDCLDKGDRNLTHLQDYDLAGNERIRGENIDMGAYEQSPLSCKMISDLSVPEDKITFTTADITWTSNGTEQEWLVYYDRVGENTPTLITVDTTYITIEELSPNLEYFVKVRAICNEIEMSPYSNPVNFTTVCHPDSVVWVNRFDTDNLLPENEQALQANSRVLFSWDHIEGAESYELWLWRADDGHGLAIPDFPVAYNITNNYHTVDLEASVYQGFGRYPKYIPYTPASEQPPGYLEQTDEEDIAYYAWKVVAYRECAAIETDTMYFNTALSDLHITAMDCSYAQTGQPMTVEWTVRNDGHGPTPIGETWYDYIVLSYPIDWTSESFNQVPYESFIMERVENLTALNVGESYTNSATIFVPDDMYGAVFLFVLSNWNPGTELGLDFAQYGGVFPNPYTPNLYGDGKPYGFMSGKNEKAGHASFEEINGVDAFFYKAIEVDIPPIPDLIANNVIPPYEHFAGDSITISWQLVNQGGAAFEDIPVTDNVYMSTENVFDSNAKMIGSFRDTISLGRDETLTRVATFATNEKDLDTYYFFVETDTRNQVYESLFENNNISPASEYPTVFMPIPPADLTIENIVLSLDTLSPNERFNISYTVKNIGYKNTNDNSQWSVDTCGNLPPTYGKPWRDVVYISTEPEFNKSNAKQLTSYNNSKILWTLSELEAIADTIDTYVYCKFPEITPPDSTAHPDEWNLYWQEKEEQDLKREALRHEKSKLYVNSYSVQKEVTIPEDYDGGKYYIHIMTDQGDNIFEYNYEDNNVISDDLTVVLPDLYVYDLTLNESRDTVSYYIKNIGDGQVIDGFILSEVNYNNAEIKSASMPRVNLMPNDSLFAQIPIQLECNFYTDNTLKVDSRLLSLESTYTNNNQTIDLQLFNPDFFADELVLPSTQLGSGETYEITYSITNNGDVVFNDTVNIKYYLGLSPELNFITAEELLSKDEILELEVGETLTITEDITLPMSADGIYYLYVSVNDDEYVCEGDNTYTNYIVSELLNVSLSPYPDFVVSQVIMPEEAMAGASISFSYTVENQGIRATFGSETWVDKIYLSSEPQFNINNAVLVGMVENYGVLDVNSLYTKTINIPIPANVMTAQYIYVVLDSDNEVFEYVGENNNVYQSPLLDVVVYDCDLEATSITCANTLQWGTTTSFSFEVTNKGTKPTTSSTYYQAIYLSMDEIPDASDIELKKITGNRLEGGASQSGSVDIVIPYGYTGNAYILLVADPDGRNPDINLNNNVLSKVVSVENVPVPDLAISGVNLVTEYPASGQPIRIAYTVTNIGDGEATSWKDKVFYSRNTLKNGVLAETKDRNMTLAPGQSYNDTTELVIPLPNIGNFAIYIEANSTIDREGNRSFFEMNYENNLGMQAVNVDFNPPGDLLVDAISHPYVVVSGDDMVVTYHLRNLGPNLLEGQGCNDVFYLSTDQAFSPDDVLLGNIDHDIVLPNYSYEEYSFTANISGVPEGEYYIIIYTDARNSFHEVDEENNRAYSAYPFEIQVPELFFDTPITFKLKDLVHKDFKLNINGNINETVRIHVSSPDAEGGAVNNIYVKHNNMGNNMDYDFSTDGDMEGNSEVYIPTTRPGYYGISVIGNDPLDDEQTVTIEANILPFEIRSVETNVAGNTGKVTVKLIGSKFRYDMPVRLFMGNPADSTMYNIIEAEELYYINFNEVCVTFDLTGAEEGVYSIEAYNYCAGYTYLMDSFLVVAGLPENLSTNLIIPEGLRQNRYCILTLEYGNIGNTDIVDPKIKLCSIGGSWIGLERGEINVHKTELDIPIGMEGEPEGILRPGVRYTVSIYCFTNESLEFVIYCNQDVNHYEQLRDEILK